MSSAAVLTLRIDPLPEEDLRVIGLRGEEALSQPFRFDVRVRTGADLLAPDPPLLGAPTTLRIDREGDVPRVVRGIVTAVASEDVVVQGRRQFTLRLAPRMALLRRRTDSRIFQDVTVTDVLDRVLGAHRVARAYFLAAPPKRHAYVVQYRETDLDFVSRICAEAGIFYYFLPPPAAATEGGAPPDEVAVFCDSAAHYPPAMGAEIEGAAGKGASLPAPPLPYRMSRSGAAVGEAAHRFTHRRAIRSTSVTLRDYDFERPRLALSAGTEQAAGGAVIEPLAPGIGALEVYEHQSEYQEAEASHAAARTKLEELRARAVIARGESSFRHASPGYRVRLQGHPIAEIDGREHTFVRVTHTFRPEGAPTPDEAGTYTNRFDCVPAEIPYRPRKRSRDLTQVLETAEVVGPAGEEVYTDAQGRIKVQFHWDREGSRNDRSSMWIRVMQAWAGASWGAQFVPRVGMEVLVSFAGGDVDRPMVLGAVYNATHPVPFPLPMSKTQSGFRTRSVGGEGSNELSFEDAKGGEVVYLKAERDLREKVQQDHQLEVSRDQRVTVGGQQRIGIEGDRGVRVGASDTSSVGGDQRVSVGRDQRIQVQGQRVETIVEGVRSTMNGLTLHNRGNHTETIEGFSAVTIGTEERPAASSVNVIGPAAWDATKSITVRSETRILLECGESSLLITPEYIRLASKRIIAHADERLTLLGDGPGIELGQEAEILGDTISLFSKGGSLELDAKAARVDGPSVKLNCGPGEAKKIEDEAPREGTRPFRWRCIDADGKPYRRKTYRLVTQGFKHKGLTDQDGVIDLDLPGDAFLAQLTLWTEEYPQGERLHYTVQLGRLPPSSSVYGAVIRLRNLGFYTGPDIDEPTPELRGALAELQRLQGIEVTGELDADTIDKLDEIHPG
jgi:type VI secretion system secreted protein VgrG